jgi:hypothetical protein
MAASLLQRHTEWKNYKMLQIQPNERTKRVGIGGLPVRLSKQSRAGRKTEAS